MNNDALSVLKDVSAGNISAEEGLLLLKMKPYEDLGYAKVDTHRKLRQGSGEVIYGAGKTPEQISGIAAALIENGGTDIIVTRISPEKAAFVRGSAGVGSVYHEIPQLLHINPETSSEKKPLFGNIIIASAGTSDMFVSEEAALTAEILGNRVTRLYDCGVAGLHRLLAHSGELMSANVVVAVAGMEGALASVIGGLVSCPVIGVPTSVGYGANFGGISALLSMLNSCASGISVVNIDNGFGAGVLASKINRASKDM
ncbi:1-(5-phosphoribosyl)-5-amino-4-imidazole-carboxylate carboxylase [Clostridia bacterium]|nr:1-(5-phosphoribosyl)-5-amino-4-imidazole-carboxylate carboxylase [Clostridia bacterium]